jgi:small GTP-binding protein
MDQVDSRIQLLIIGDSEVGKTSILYRYANNQFSSFYLATVGIDYFTKDDVIDNKKIKVKIWDTAGQERYKSLTTSFFRNAQGIILAFDLSNAESFENLKYWIQSLNANLGENTQIKKIIFGNKVDLKREVEKEVIESFTQENNIPYFEGSAKDDINVSESIRTLIKTILQNMPKPEINDTILIDDKKKDKYKEGCC